MATRLDQLESAGVSFEDPNLRDQYDLDAIDALTDIEFDMLLRVLEKLDGEYPAGQTPNVRWL